MKTFNLPRISLFHIRRLALILALILLAYFAGYQVGTGDLVLPGRQEVRISRQVPQQYQLDFSLFWLVWDQLSTSFLDKEALEPAKMVYGAIKGMVASLGDPYTVFLDPEENTQAKEDLNGEFEGVGLQLGFKDGQLAVIAPLPGTPAARAGIKAGDLILAIEDQDTAGMSLPEAVKLIRGPQGTTVKLTLLHQGEEKPYDASLVRETIVVKSVELEVQDGVAILRLLRFAERTADEWYQAVDRIALDPEIEALILDVRNNPGGFLSGSVFIASEFLPDGVVVIQEGTGGARETYQVDRLGKLLVHPLVVLVNGGSASASEIVAGALSVRGRATLVGELTFGKGTIQEAQDLPGGTGLHVTTARWLLPDGSTIDEQGVRPDVEIADDPDTQADEQLLQAIEVVKSKL